MWLLVALIGQIFIGASAVFDKVLLKRIVPRPLQYSFGFGILAVLVLLLVPFGFQIPPLWIVPVALLAGFLFFTAVFLAFEALKHTQASETLLAVGGLSPIFTLLASYIVLGNELSVGEWTAFGLLAAGSLLFSFRHYFGLIFVASVFFGFGNAFHKLVFNHTNFITGLVLVQMGIFLSAAFLLIFPNLRKKIFTKSAERPRSILLFISNRILGAAGTFLLTIAIFLAHPALVDVTAGFRYLIIFAIAFWILKEQVRGWILAERLMGIGLVLSGLIVLAGVNYVQQVPLVPAEDMEWGATFSAKFSRDLGLDWQNNYLALLDDLKLRRLRLIAYWDEIEPEDDQYRWEDLDWQMNEAAKRNAKVILAIGQKVPRWPECFLPKWAEGNEKLEMRDELLEYLKTVVERYKNHPALDIWQVENEPYFKFGNCSEFNEELFRKEIALVKFTDLTRPIMVTESGEFGTWRRGLEYGDLLGITMYRQVHHSKFGQLTYPLPAWFWRLKTVLSKPYAVIEMQAEPWGPGLLPDLPLETQLKILPIQRFQEYLEYAKQTGFDKFYLWGSEWIYFMKQQGYPEYWALIRQVLK